ncbi:sox transcription factor [Holotrichia oblita]|uniref:Core-binding factor beta subunit n=2 Tax=Holotrichia oblita TaxID=644536 RepID=A0ACB9TDA0_HOLOL|nr:core-binding factor beta subunit [Holotrichia oblita]KAI4464800.1 sox transcription factor [Holotrichia oblita]
MPHQYSTALSHMILAGTGLYCMIQYRHGEICQLPCATFGIIITNSVLGIWRWGNPDHGDKIEKPYNFTFFLQSIFVMPFIAGQMWLMNGYERAIAYLHPMLSCIPLTAYFVDKNNKEDVIDLLMVLSVLSCGALSYQINNYYGMAAAISFSLNHFYINNKDNIFDVPGRDFYNYALCFFTYFAYRAVVVM